MLEHTHISFVLVERTQNYVFVNHKYIQVICVWDTQISVTKFNFVFMIPKNIISSWLKICTWSLLSGTSKILLLIATGLTIALLFWQCVSCISSSFSLLLFVMGRRRGGQRGSTHGIGRTFGKLCQLRSNAVDLRRFLDALWSRWSCPHGKNCLDCETIKHSSQWWGLTPIPSTDFCWSLVQCFLDTCLLMSLEG